MIHKSMSLKYEPSSEPLHIAAKQLLLNRELYRTVLGPGCRAWPDRTKKLSGELNREAECSNVKWRAET